jgi:hypothetical protein
MRGMGADGVVTFHVIVGRLGGTKAARDERHAEGQGLQQPATRGGEAGNDRVS